MCHPKPNHWWGYHHSWAHNGHIDKCVVLKIIQYAALINHCNNNDLMIHSSLSQLQSGLYRTTWLQVVGTNINTTNNHYYSYSPSMSIIHQPHDLASSHEPVENHHFLHQKRGFQPGCTNYQRSQPMVPTSTHGAQLPGGRSLGVAQQSPGSARSAGGGGRPRCPAKDHRIEWLVIELGIKVDLLVS